MESGTHTNDMSISPELNTGIIMRLLKCHVTEGRAHVCRYWGEGLRLQVLDRDLARAQLRGRVPLVLYAVAPRQA